MVGPPNTTGYVMEQTEPELLSSDSLYSQEKDPYPNWCFRNGAPISANVIREQFEKLATRFQFQNSNMENMYEYLMCQLNSRASRTSGQQALLSIHRDYIGGDNANYKKWYFAVWSAMESEYSVKEWNQYKSFKNLCSRMGNLLAVTAPPDQERPSAKSIDLFNNAFNGDENGNPLLKLEFEWKSHLYKASELDYIQQLALYLMIWGEANNIRFIPEGLCFIFKICWDHWKEQAIKDLALPENYFLDQVISPLYKYVRDQKYQQASGGVWKRRNLSHDRTISYDDMNQFFWHPDLIKKIVLKNGGLFQNIEKKDRFLHFQYIDWSKCFFKTYRETRTWCHLLLNFGRVWIIHVTMFWFFTVFNSPTLYTVNYSQLLNNPPPPQVQLTMVSLGGVIPPLITMMGIVLELIFIPRKFPGAAVSSFSQFFFCAVTLSINLAPSLYILLFIPLSVYSIHGYWLSVFQFCWAVATLIYFATTPHARLFGCFLSQNINEKRIKEFAANFAPLDRRGQIHSLILWLCVFGAKFTESYFFLTLSFRDPIRVVSIMVTDRCHSDSIISSKWICKLQPKFILVLLILTDFVLFFLDTYLWYIICNCLFSIILSLQLGISVLTPWRNIFLRLPERILSKIVYPKSAGSPASLISLVWNAIIISMFREHLLSVEQTQKLLFMNLADGNIRPPVFFVFQDDSSFSLKDFFVCGKEAERRITFLAHSISSSLKEPIPVKAMPMFTVLVPHYSEKIILSLREVLKEPHQSRISMLEYLKQLHSEDWNIFVKDTKALQKGTNLFEGNNEGYMNMESTSKNSVLEGQLRSGSVDSIIASGAEEKNEFYETMESRKEAINTYIQNEINDIPYYCIGFKDSTHERSLRTRIWASLRCQTLYRTVSGFTNYDTGLRILYQAENKEEMLSLLPAEADRQLDMFCQSKFQLLVAMQKFQSFTDSDYEDAKSLFEAFPQLKVCYLEEEKTESEINYYSCLLDLSNRGETGNYRAKHRIKLSGNPILGDGKADNQNNAIIFSRGEYIQTIDANQDNYIEECLKIKSILAEFDELQIDALLEYLPGSIGCVDVNQVAIVGAREYIFSENIGVLGDVAAAKEQTFGTLFARTLAAIGAKLHYGHPDFLNAIFMTTRGGISKATRELHLNEDIYAGMNAVSRGGKIKHCDFYQCGKGRDLGFGTILNFTSKIGSGMGEQLLSREYYYLGTNLPTDRFLSFYYAHAGFHVNNMFILLSIKLVIILLVNLAALAHESIICFFDPKAPITDLQQPLGCYNLQPIIQWISRFVLSICICFLISFLPLIIQESIEKGARRTFIRVGKHLLSLTPLFEVFVCNIYAESLRRNIVYGGATYVPTGRGFAIIRNSFLCLYSRYATLSIHRGAVLAISVIFISTTIWQPAILWFYITVFSLCYSPFLFNPHQFVLQDFILDYRDLLRWFFRGNRKCKTDSWISYLKFEQALSIGQKLKAASTKKITPNALQRPSRWNCFWDRLLLQNLKAIAYFMSYLFINSQNGVRSPSKVSPILRVICVSIFPLVANCVTILLSLICAITITPLLRLLNLDISSIISTVSYLSSVLFHIFSFVVLFLCENWNIPRTLCGLLFVISLHNFLLQLAIFFVTREPHDNVINQAWWTGGWIGRGMNFCQAFGLILRETYVKIYEINLFAYDYILAHCIYMSMIPIALLPLADKLHTTALMWLMPSKQFQAPIMSRREVYRRRWRVFKYSILLFLHLLVIISMVICPPILDAHFGLIERTKQMLGSHISTLLFQPVGQDYNDTGPNAPLKIPRKTPAYTMSTIR